MTNKLYDNEEREIEVLDLLVEKGEELYQEKRLKESEVVFDLYQKIGCILITGESNEDGN